MFLILVGEKKTFICPQLPTVRGRLPSDVIEGNYDGLCIHLANQQTIRTNGFPEMAYVRLVGVETKTGMEIDERDARLEGFRDFQSFVNWFNYHYRMLRDSLGSIKAPNLERYRFTPIDIVRFELKEITREGFELLGNMKDALLEHDYDFYREVVHWNKESNSGSHLESAAKQAFIKKKVE